MATTDELELGGAGSLRRRRPLRRLAAWLVGVLVLLLAVGYAVGGKTADPSAGCSSTWHPEVYCAPGYYGEHVGRAAYRSSARVLDAARARAARASWHWVTSHGVRR